MKDRLELALIGAFAGLSLWALFEFLDTLLGRGHLLVALLIGASVFFSALMALVGPERPFRALPASLALGGSAAVLAFLAAWRFETADAFLNVGHPMFALFTLFMIGTPFAAAALEEPKGWRHYARLFDSAWGIFIRYVAGWLFAGLILIVLYLSDELLKLVGIRLLGDLLDVDWIFYTLLGAMFGLGVATVYELRGYVSPVLVHRLLRMLLPLVLGVVIIFLGALPFRGLSELFGNLSTGAVLMSVAFAGVTLITTALDRDDENASGMAVMTVSARLMALLLPALVLLSIYAVWLRVAAYGWTPQRVIAAYIALFLAGYAGVYVWAVLRGRNWQAQLRQGNLYMALAVLCGAALWLTPLINAEAISAKSQVARFERGEGELDDLPLYEMAHDWGRAGEAALVQLEAAGEEAVAKRIALAREARGRWSFRRDTERRAAPVDRADLATRLIVQPEGAEIAQLLEALEEDPARRMNERCPAGDKPRCVVVMLPPTERPFPKAAALWSDASSRYVQSIMMKRGGEAYFGAGLIAYDESGQTIPFPGDAFTRFTQGAFEIKPITRHVIEMDGVLFYPSN